jgi:hypothetical protein
MPIDMRRVIRAAVEAALEDPAPKPRRKRRLSSGRALLIGAGLMTAGKLAASARGRELFGTIKDRVADAEGRLRGTDDALPDDEAELDEQEEIDAEEEEQTGAVNGEELDEDEELDELDEDEPEPELEEDEQPSRDAPTRRSRGRK